MIRHDDDIVTGSATYTLFLEYLGGLVPLLKGKRASKLRPEFVIFDPQQPDEGRCKENISNSSPPHKINSFNQATPSSHARFSSSDSEVDEGCASPRMQRRRRQRRQNYSKEGEWICSSGKEILYVDELPEQYKIVAVTSNIWGTKFKILGLASWLPTLLGTVTYRTSLLHLQPRQMTLVIKELRGPQPPEIETCHDDETICGNSIATAAAAVFSEDDDDMLDPEIMGYEESAPIAPMTPRKQHTETFHCQQLKSDEDDYLTLSQEEGDYVNFITTEEFSSLQIVKDKEYHVINIHPPTETRMFEGNVVSVATQTNLNSISDHHLQPSIPSSLSTTTISICTNSFSEELKGFVVNETDEVQVITDTQNQLRLPSCSSSGAGSSPLHGNIPQQDHGLLSAVNTDLGASSPGSYSVFSGSLSLSSSCSTDSDIGNNEERCNLDDVLQSSSIIDDDYNQNSLGTNLIPKYEPSSVESSESKAIQPNCQNIKEICGIVPKQESYQAVSEGAVNITSTNVIMPPSYLPAASRLDSLPRWAEKTGELKYIDEDIEESFDVNTSGYPQSLPPSTVFLLSHCSRNVGTFHNGEFTAIRERQGSASIKDKQRRLTLKSRAYSEGNTHCAECHSDEMMHEQDTPSGGAKSALYGCFTKQSLSCIYDTNCVTENEGAGERSEVSSQHTGAICFDPSINQLIISDKRQNSANLTCSEQDVCKSLDSSQTQEEIETLEESVSHCLMRHRSSLPHTDALIESASLPSPISRSIPSSPITRRRTVSQRRGLLYSPLLLRKVRRQRFAESSDEEGGLSADDAHSEDFRDLESFQKAYIRKKLKKWRGHSVADGPQSTSNTANYREFVLHNKAPLWNEVSQVYQLDFGGRVTQESAKNFQIEFRGKQVMQFGRIDGNAYTLDFQYPFSALQAFAVALANVTQRLK